MTGSVTIASMRTCPKCGYVDPEIVAADRRYDRQRDKKARAAYMRAYRRKQKAKVTKGAKR